MPFNPGRRNVLLGASGTLTAVLTGALLPAPATASSSWTAGATPASIGAAFSFLNSTFDGSHLPRSYSGGFLSDFVSSFAYDDALVIMAWLARGDVRRAVALGDMLLYTQQRDPIGDGRTRASYQPGTFEIGSAAAFTGNQAWVGMALAQLYARTRRSRFLAGALREAQWIQDKTWDGTRAPYGYTGGRTADDQPNMFKATEHNIDVGAFFTMLAQLTGRRVWRARAQAAFAFVAAMQDHRDGHVWTGTDPDGTTTNRVPIPEDVQTWARLATGDRRYDRSVTWVLDKLAAFDATVYGVSYSDTDTSKVWLEGTAHTALALQARQARGDTLLNKKLLWNIGRAQANTPHGDGRGIPAASSDGLDTGFGDVYYASLHTGATAWYLLAALGRNPFQL
ncbi:hypothetical protein AB0J83_12010 [Actinoplanes sp. NPDC049596]|uniref:hypothetical protein n=1 Tax=unclassified Actinoplanes TaxID=2626549 RepID=UPI003434EF80